MGHQIVIMNQPAINLCPTLPTTVAPQPSGQPLYFLPAIYPPPLPLRPTEAESPDESPESSNGKKVYNCQRCLNHGIEVKRRNHKSVCPFNSCHCPMCEMVSARSELNNEFALECEEAADVDVEVEVVDLESNPGEPEPSLDTGSGTAEKTDEKKPEGVNKVRDPRCQQCAAHGKNFPLKNHKKICPYRKCECKKCKIVFRRRNLMAKQIKLRRQQKQKKQMESAALELRKQLEKMAERERQQAAVLSFFPLPPVGSVVPSQSSVHSHLAGHISFHANSNCWPHYSHSGCTWPEHNVPSISSVPVFNLPSSSGGSCGNNHFGIFSGNFPNLHSLASQSAQSKPPVCPCLGCIQAHNGAISSAPTQLAPPSGGLPKLFCPQHAHQAHQILSNFQNN